MNDEFVTAVIALLAGISIGWVAFAFSVMSDCEKLNGFTAGAKAYSCEERKK